MAYVTVNTFNTQLQKIGEKTLYSAENVSLDTNNLENVQGDLEKFNFVDLMNVLSYKKPTVSLSSSLSDLVYEIGITVHGGHTLTATVVKGTSDIAGINFYEGDTLLSTIVDDTVVNGGNFTFSSGNDITSDKNYKVVVTCEDGTTIEDTLSIRFYNPYYHGVISKELDEITATDIMAMTKDISGKEEKKYSYTSANEYCLFAYDKSYGLLTSLLDNSKFENIFSWDYKEIEVNGAIYLCYCTNTKVICSDFEYTFKN